MCTSRKVEEIVPGVAPRALAGSITAYVSTGHCIADAGRGIYKSDATTRQNPTQSTTALVQKGGAARDLAHADHCSFRKNFCMRHLKRGGGPSREEDIKRRRRRRGGARGEERRRG
eukprot:3934337-Rhodomonas_salina.1